MTQTLRDPRARAAWRMFRMRVELMLGSVSAPARHEILADLESHVREALQRSQGGDEHARLMAALERIGDPREFLEPLVAEAVFRRPRSANTAVLAWQALLLGAQRGVQDLTRAVGLIALGLFGVAAIVLGVRTLMASERAGVFLLDQDTIQVRLLGAAGAAGVQLLPAWGAVLVAVVGVGLTTLSIRSLRRLVVALLIHR